MNFKVGDVVVRDFTDDEDAVEMLPAGTVVKDPSGKTRVVSDLTTDVFLFTDHGAAPRGPYEIALLPEQTDPSEELAQELWSVKSSVSMAYFGFEEDWSEAHDYQQTVFRALAYYIRDVYPTPLKVDR